MMSYKTRTDGKSETVTIRLLAGSGKRIDKVLKGGELRAAFVRHAVEAELERREKQLPRVTSS